MVARFGHARDFQAAVSCALGYAPFVRLFASSDPLDAGVDRMIACHERYVQPVAERIFPDGAVHLIFNVGDRPTGERGANLRCLAMGATLGATNIVLAGTVDQVCVRVRIGAAAAVLGVPAIAITDDGVALDALWGSAADDALDQLAEATGAARIATIERILRDRISRAEPPAPAVGEALRRITAAGGQLRVRDLVRDLGVGERRLQQLFHAQVGLSPKETCRLARFRAVVARWRSERDRSWSELAVEGGFYDQAHLVHELRAFTGLTPTQLDDFGFFQDPLLAAS